MRYVKIKGGRILLFLWSVAQLFGEFSMATALTKELSKKKKNTRPFRPLNVLSSQQKTNMFSLGDFLSINPKNKKNLHQVNPFKTYYIYIVKYLSDHIAFYNWPCFFFDIVYFEMNIHVLFGGGRGCEVGHKRNIFYFACIKKKMKIYPQVGIILLTSHNTLRVLNIFIHTNVRFKFSLFN